MVFADFNSIKVRLERVAFLSVRSPPVFQFHKGAIRTREANDRINDNCISIP